MKRVLVLFIMLWAATNVASPTIAHAGCGGSQVPVGQIVSFKALANDKYVTAEKNYNPEQAPLLANRERVGDWEQFLIEDAGGGYIALKALANDKYVRASFDYDNGNLIADTDKEVLELPDSALFFWITNPDGTVSLRLKENGKYVVADLGNPFGTWGTQVLANRDWNRKWEKFQVTADCTTLPDESVRSKLTRVEAKRFVYAPWTSGKKEKVSVDCPQGMYPVSGGGAANWLFAMQGSSPTTNGWLMEFYARDVNLSTSDDPHVVITVVALCASPLD